MTQYNIGDYKIQSKAVYNSLMNNNLTSTKQLKKLDTNRDGKISEDELQQFSDDSDTVTSSASRSVSRKVDKDGNVTKRTVTETNNGNKITTSIYYDKEGNITKKVTQSGSGSDKITKTTTYSNGIRSKAQVVTGSSGNQVVKIIEYDKNGKQTSTKTYRTKPYNSNSSRYYTRYDDGYVNSGSSEVAKVCRDVNIVANTIRNVVDLFKGR